MLRSCCLSTLRPRLRACVLCLILLIAATPASALAAPATIQPVLSHGWNHVLAIKSDGSLWGWGSNWDYELGVGDNADRSRPVALAQGMRWRTVSAGDRHSLAIAADGSLWAWGDDYDGQVGNGGSWGGSNVTSPQRIGSDTDWISVSAGSSHSLALKSDGTLWAWGATSNGQCGVGYTQQGDITAPIQVGSGMSWVSVVAGAHHSLALKADGTLWGWGFNNCGQAGSANTASIVWSPVQVGSDRDWMQADAGGLSSFGIKVDGSLWAWGYNSSGQLGDGTTTNRIAPVAIGPTYVRWRTVAAGDAHTVAISSDGAVWAWGNNGSNRLGDAVVTSRPVPETVAGASSGDTAIAGTAGSGVLRTDGSVRMWGANESGQLGNGSWTGRSTPTFTTWLDATAPATHAQWPSRWTRGPVSVDLTATDGLSGIDAVTWRLDDGASAILEGPIAVAKEGISRVSFFATDRAGNVESTQTIVVKVDDSPPSTSSDATDLYDGTADIRFSATDLLSGVAYTRLCLDGVSEIARSSTVTTLPGSHLLEYSSVDWAGNAESTRSVPFRVRATSRQFKRVAGTDRFETSALASQRSFPDGAHSVVMATGYNWPDALAGASLAGVLDAPILLTRRDMIPDSTLAELKRLNPGVVVLVGGTVVLSDEVKTTIEREVGARVERLSGDDRYATSVAVARSVAAGDHWDGTAIVTTGMDFPDALAASPLAAAKGWPVFLSAPQGLPAATLDEMRRMGVRQVVMLGSDRAVAVGVESSLRREFGMDQVTRLAGPDRFGTAAAIADFSVERGLRWHGLGVATGRAFPDALAGGVMLGRKGSVLLLTDPRTLPEPVSSVLTLQRDWIGEVIFLGADPAVSPGVREQVRRALER